MKNYILIIFSFFYVIMTNAQDSLRLESIDTFKFDSKTLEKNNTYSLYTSSFKLPECPYNKRNAQKDIERKTLSIIVHGGFTGFGEMNEKRSADFQKKYNVKFVYLGCMRFWDTASEDTFGYNEIIFMYLESKYGKIVKKEFNNIWLNN